MKMLDLSKASIAEIKKFYKKLEIDVREYQEKR
jgi:hypothetical protein